MPVVHDPPHMVGEVHPLLPGTVAVRGLVGAQYVAHEPRTPNEVVGGAVSARCREHLANDVGAHGKRAAAEGMPVQLRRRRVQVAPMTGWFPIRLVVGGEVGRFVAHGGTVGEAARPMSATGLMPVDGGGWSVRPVDGGSLRCRRVRWCSGLGACCLGPVLSSSRSGWGSCSADRGS